MTVVATVITQHCTAHASDSLITEPMPNGKLKIRDSKTTKIVCVPPWTGLLSYYGLASDGRGWSTLNWLREKANHAANFDNPQSFADHIATELTDLLSGMTFDDPLKKGIGIHFTAYEQIGDDRIPELFHITNYANIDYSALHKDGLRVTRETYASIPGNTNTPSIEKTSYMNRTPQKCQHSKVRFRRDVNKFLKNGNLLLYANGDHYMFNPAAAAVFHMIQEAMKRRGHRAPGWPRRHREIVEFPIGLVSEVQHGFLAPGYRTVGGKLHSVSVTPSGRYSSETGDTCEP